LLLLILNLGTRWGLVVSIMPRPRFTPRERTPGTHCTGSWVGPRAGLDAEARGKILCPCRGSNPDRPARSQMLYYLSYRGSQLMNNELEMLRRKQSWPNLRYYPSICLEGLRKPQKHQAGWPASMPRSEHKISQI
jgi:hypothetical protein